MKHWDEVRTAYHVARFGTVSAAAEALGVHHSTVIRHIDALEAHLGLKLFQRHARGYTPTEAGSEVLRVAQATEDQMNQLESRLRGGGDELKGEIVITSLQEVSHFITPILAKFRAAHPDVQIRYMITERLFRLEFGEAHVAIRAGEAGQDPDNVIQPFFQMQMGLFASQTYVDRYGDGIDPDGLLSDHLFVCNADEALPAPHYMWIRENVPPEQIVFSSTDGQTLIQAVQEGIGCGFVERGQAQDLGLVEVTLQNQDWRVPLSLVTHVDLHRTPKVQAILKFLKDACKQM